MDRLRDRLTALGFEVRRWESLEAEVIFAECFFPRLLGDVSVQIKANPDVLHFSLYIAYLDDPKLLEGSLLLDLMRINFRHAFGRLSVADVTRAAATDAADAEPAAQMPLLIAETMMFWRHSIQDDAWFAQKIERRLQSLRLLMADAFDVVSARR